MSRYHQQLENGILRHKGFTLVEALVAVSIMVIAVAGPLYSSYRTLISAKNAEHRLTASYLAQEGIEYIRAMRDDAYLDRYRANDTDMSINAWAHFTVNTTGFEQYSIESCQNSANGCALDTAKVMGTGSGKALSVCASECSELYTTASSPKLYTLDTSGNTKTPYKRTIKIQSVSSEEKRIISTVKWNFHNQDYTVEVVDHVTPWQ